MVTSCVPEEDVTGDVPVTVSNGNPTANEIIVEINGEEEEEKATRASPSSIWSWD